jgi:hypothetical protein
MTALLGSGGGAAMRFLTWRQLTNRWGRFEGAPPVETVPIGWTLRNGVVLDNASIYRNGVVVAWTNPNPGERTGAASLPTNVRRVELRGPAIREHARERRRRYRELGLVFSSPVLQLRADTGRRFRGGGLAGGTDDGVFRGETTFRVSAARFRTGFTIRCAGERVMIQLPAG